LLVLAVNQILAEASIPLGQDIRRDQTRRLLIEDMKAGSVHTLIMSGVNPVYTLADTASFVEGLKKVTTVSLTLKEHETALVSTIAAPVPHFWGDLSTKGAYSNATYNPL
jgi:molybdopterin-containing oxidoreductase family iron-sulfur binding subunit